MNIYYHPREVNRKELCQALSEILDQESKYLGAPSFAYVIGEYSISKDAVIACPKELSIVEYQQLVLKLTEKGFRPDSTDTMLFVASLPKEQFDQSSIARLYNLVSSKEHLLRAALNTQSLPIEIDETKIKFPWFILTGADGETDAFLKLVTALGKMAREQKRISSVEKPVDNLKYAMRLFLVRLGFVGSEYKTARKILLSRLSGNGSWRNGRRPDNNGDLNMNGGNK